MLAVRDRNCFWSHDISLAHAEKSKCKGRWFLVSSRTQVETQATHLATAKDAQSHAENSKCKGRWFPVSSHTQVETQATHLATAKDARSTNAAVHEYVFWTRRGFRGELAQQLP